MDPRGKTGHGLFEDLRRSEDGTEYLRLLKEQSSESAPSAPTPAPASPSPSAAPAGRERRRSPRFHCSGSAEFRVEGSDVRLWGTLTDLSRHGCYIEMNNTFPVNTRVRLLLEAMGIRTQMEAVVRVSYPFLGMGLGFLKIEPGHLLQLERLLAVLAAPASPSSSASTPAPTATSTHSLADVDPTAMLDELTEFFRTHPLLSRQEFYQIAKRARR